MTNNAQIDYAAMRSALVDVIGRGDYQAVLRNLQQTTDLTSARQCCAAGEAQLQKIPTYGEFHLTLRNAASPVQPNDAPAPAAGRPTPVGAMRQLVHSMFRKAAPAPVSSTTLCASITADFSPGLGTALMVDRTFPATALSSSSATDQPGTVASTAEICAALTSLTDFVQCPAFQQLLDKMSRIAAAERPQFVTDIFLNRSVLKGRAIETPVGLTIQRAPFAGDSPPLFGVTKPLNEREQVTITFDNREADPLPAAHKWTTEEGVYAIIPNFLSGPQCDQIEALFSQIAATEGTVVDEDKAVVRKSTRKSFVRWMGHDTNMEWLFMHILKALAGFNAQAVHVEISGLHEGTFQLTEYREGGQYTWHTDSGPGFAALRRISLVIQLSAPEAYTGGVLELITPQGTITCPAGRGTLILFTSNTKHRVTPVKKGMRRSLVGWFITG